MDLFYGSLTSVAPCWGRHFKNSSCNNIGNNQLLIRLQLCCQKQAAVDLVLLTLFKPDLTVFHSGS